MTTTRYRDTAEAGWRWTLDQVHHDDAGVWIPVSVPADGGPPASRDGVHSGVGGLAHVLAEIRLLRPWTDEEQALADAVVARVRADVATTTAYDYFDGLVGHLGVLTALGAEGSDAVVARLLDLAEPDGWPNPEGARWNDATLGTASVLIGGVWASRHDVPQARELAGHAADVLLSEAEPTDHGVRWPFQPLRYPLPAWMTERAEMPNWSHGTAGVGAALAVAGVVLERPELVDVARRGAEDVVALADTRGGGLVVPRRIPPKDGDDPVTFTWCHGPPGTQLLFAALQHAGVADVAGETPTGWRERCWRSVRASGIPERRHPGFWDNDGRCCGTAGVGDLALDAGHADLATSMADALVARAVRDGDRACWRFVEHRDPEPLLPPGVGWFQGAAGIAAFLFRMARGGSPLPRMDTWWAQDVTRAPR